MADEPAVETPEVPTQDPDTFSPGERAYFDSRGEKEIPTTEEKPAEAAEEKKEESVAEVPTAKTDEAIQEERKVNLGALHEERAKRKAAEERIRDFEIMQARWEERFRAAQPQEQPQAPPSPDEDIFGAVKHDRNEITRIRQELQAQQRRQQADQQRVQFANWASSQEAEFKKATPDYDQAFVHLRDARAKELKDGWNMNDVQVAQQLQQEWQQIVHRAAQERVNPAERVYALAKVRGYQAKAPATDESKKLDVIEAGQEASKSLSGVGGKSGGGSELTAMDVLKMPVDEFDAWKNKNPAKFRRIMGATH